MTTWEALLLGIIQGLTEFLPVSSSGHLELGQYLLGYQQLNRYVLFNLVCHLGTLLAILFVFFSQIKQSLTTQKTKAFQILIGTLPLFPLALILKPIKAVFDQPHYLGYCFLFSSFLIFSGSFIRLRKSNEGIKNRWLDSLTIGLFQAVAVLPGISRSGATISAASWLGWKKEEAVNFSFLLAIPAILGAAVLETIQLIRLPDATSVPIDSWQFGVGFLSSFIVGCCALWLLKRLLIQNKWIYFGWYCLFLGLFTISYFNFFV